MTGLVTLLVFSVAWRALERGGMVPPLSGYEETAIVLMGFFSVWREIGRIDTVLREIRCLRTALVREIRRLRMMERRPPR